jgi:1,4-alpha-glucan branching enzyme
MTEAQKVRFHQGELYDAYRFLGCQFDKKAKKATFRVYAPAAKSVSLVGDFNGWNKKKHVMQRDADGLFEIEIDGVKLYDGYKFCIKTKNGELFKSDPYAFHCETQTSTNSKVYSLDLIRIKDEAYRERTADRELYNAPMSVYEAHIGSWRRYPDGNPYDYRKFADEIVPYLKEMKYTHLELMGIAEYPFDGSWGYQVTGYYAPTSRYGTPADFAYLVQKLHRAKLALILDWVPGHFPKDANGLYEFDGGPLYEPKNEFRKEHKEWGTRCFDYGRAEVQTFLCANALMWFDVYHVDGLRVDAVASMLYLDYGRKSGEWERNYKGGSENLEAVAFLQKLNTAIFARHPKAMMIAEESTAWPLVTKPVALGGLGFNFKWNMGWMNDALDYIKTDPLFRAGKHNCLTFSLTYAFSENYVLPVSHDEVVHGKGSLLGKMPGAYELKFAGLRGFLMYMFAHPGKKLMFMGAEWGQFIEWDYKKQLDWPLLEYPAHEEMRQFVRTLNAAYRKYAPLWDIENSFDGFKWNVVDDKNQNVVVFERLDRRGGTVLCVVNFSPVAYNNYRFGCGKGAYRTVLASDTAGFRVRGETYKTVKTPSHGFMDSLSLNIPGLAGIYLYKSAPKTGTRPQR